MQVSKPMLRTSRTDSRLPGRQKTADWWSITRRIHSPQSVTHRCASPSNAGLALGHSVHRISPDIRQHRYRTPSTTEQAGRLSNRGGDSITRGAVFHLLDLGAANHRRTPPSIAKADRQRKASKQRIRVDLAYAYRELSRIAHHVVDVMGFVGEPGRVRRP